MPNIVSCKEDLRGLCDRIDGLECIVGRVKQDLDLVESQIEAAEATCETEGLFRNMLKPLFFVSKLLHINTILLILYLKLNV